VKLLAGAGERARICDRAEDFQLPKVHLCSTPHLGSLFCGHAARPASLTFEWTGGLATFL
jgi:hypothetical protein